MQRNLIIAGVGAALVLVLGLGAYLVFRTNGDDIALAQLDRLVRTYDGEYTNATYDTAADRLVVDGLLLRNYVTSAGAEPLDLIQVDHLDATGLARFDLRDVMNGNRAQRLFTTFDATGVTLTEGGQSITVESISMRDVSFEGGGGQGNGNGSEGAQAVARLALLLNTGEVRVTGFSSPPEGPTGMTLGTLTIENMRGGSVDNVTAENVSLWDNGQMGTVGDTVRLDAGQVTVAGLDAHVPLERMAAGESVRFNRQSNVPIYDRFEIGDLTVHQENGQPLTIGSFSMANGSYEGPMPTQTSVEVGALRLPLNGEFVASEDSAGLRELGYDTLVFNMAYSSSYDFSAREFSLSNMSIGIEDMGELRIDMRVIDIPFTEDMIDQSAEALLADGFVASLLESAALQSGTLSYVDDGLFGRVIASNAEKAGQTPDEYLQSTIDELQGERQEVASSELAVQTIDALIAFFQDPGALTVTLAPETPVPVQQMAVAVQINPLILVELLNLQVAAEN